MMAEEMPPPRSMGGGCGEGKREGTWVRAIAVRRRLAAFAVGLVLCGAGAAHAAGTDEIVVTATRRESLARALPSNISRLGGDEIAFVRADQASELLNRVPGLDIQRGNGVEHLTAMRSPVLTGGAGAGSFLYLENGVPLRAAGFANVNGLFEAHSEIAGAVEVVRGPGSALYGSNAVHGLVNFLTRTPADGGFVDMSVDSRDRLSGNGVTGAVSGAQGYLGGLTLVHEGGNRAASGLDTQKLTLRHDYDGPSVRVQTIFSGINLNQETAGFVDGPRAYRNRALTLQNVNPEAYRDAQSLRLSSRIDLDSREGLRLSLVPYARWNEMTLLQHFLPSKAIEESGHWSLGLLATTYVDLGERSSLVLGVDTEYTDGFLKEVQTLASFGTFPQGVHYDYDVAALVLAPYAHLEWQLAERLRLVAGLRAEWTRYDYATRTPADTVGRFKRPGDREDEFFTLTPKLGLVADVAPDLAAFVNLSRGARAPQTSDLYRLQPLQTVEGIKSETIDSAELGLRGTVLKARFEIAAYWMRKEHFFFRNADGYNVSDGRTLHRGIEAEAQVPLLPTLTLAFSGTYARHTYDFDDIVGNASEIVRSGNDVDTAPRAFGSVRLQWRPVERVLGELEWTHEGRYYSDAANAHSYPGHDLFNVRLSVRATPRLTVFAAVRNLLNTDYAERADYAFGTDRYFPGEGITPSAGLRLSW